MIKGKWFTRALHVTIALSFVLGAFVVAPSVSADPGTSQWEKQGMPTEADKVLLPGSDIIDFDVAGDGKTIYAIGTLHQICESTVWAEEYGPDDLFSNWQYPKLWKSTDGGITWKDQTSKVLDAKNLPDLPDMGWTTDAEDFTFFTAVSVAPDDPKFVVVTGWGYDTDATSGYNYVPVVVGSNDGAAKFNWMGCSAVSGMITCVDVAMEVDDAHSIAIGTWDWENESDDMGGNYDNDLGKVWRYDAGGYWGASWADTSVYDGWYPVDAVVDLEFSPNFDVDDAIVALCIGDVDDDDAQMFLDGADADGIPDYMGYLIQGGVWDSIDGWNVDAEFDSYPVVVTNDDYVIVSPIDTDLGSGWDAVGALVRHAGDIDLPFDYMADDSSDRKMMVAVNGMEWNITDSPDSAIDDGGFLFWIENTKISLEMLDHEDNPYIATIDYSGNIDMEGRTLVGLAFPKTWRWTEISAWYTMGGPADENALPLCAGVPVLRSETTDVCCPDWSWACKPPTGQFMATVMMTPDGDWAYAGTMGESYLWGYHGVGMWTDESAFSISGHEGDLGNAWNQESLIDTDIDFVSDVAVTSNGDGSDLCAPSCQCIYVGTINLTNELEPGMLDEFKVGSCDSIWRSCDGGKTWLRIWNKALAGDVMDADDPFDWAYDGDIEWMDIELVPGEEVPMTIYMADLGTETVWTSVASGDACCPAGLGCWTDRNTGLGFAYTEEGDKGIADIAVLDESTIYAVAFNADMVKSTSGGRHWSSQVDTKVDDDSGEWAHTMVVMGDWVLVGGTMGTVTYSDDGGDSFAVLDDIGGGTDHVHVAFDSYFDDNGYIYAAVAGEDAGVYRTTIDDADFEDMDACDSVNYWGIDVSDGAGNPKTSASTGGVLYASYNGTGDIADNSDCANAGVARILNPAAQDCCGSLSWDYLWDNLWAYAFAHGQSNNIALCGDASGGATTIFVIDVAPRYDGDSYYAGWDECYTKLYDSNVGRLWKFNDVFSKSGPALISVANGATIPSDPCDCVNEDFVLEWDRLCDACEYDIQIAMDEGFKHIVYNTSYFANSSHTSCGSGVFELCESDMEFYKPSDPCAPSIVIPQGTLDCNQTYWWRVRARVAETDETYRSWWSAKWSFTIAVGPDGAIQLTAPDDGATNVPLQNVVFTWTAVADATSYELKIWDATGKEIGKNAADVTSFVLTSKLGYDSAYMWQVKAMKGSNVLSESQVSTFRTMMQPTPAPEIPETVINFPEPAGTPSWVWVVIALAAILIIVVIVLIFRTRRV